MSKTADVERGLWTEPWFLALPPDAKHLYLWGRTCPHANMAGLFIVGRPTILLETALTSKRLDVAFSALRGRMFWDETTGALWVVDQAKKVRTKTVQMAKSIVKAIEDCPLPALRTAFLEKYGDAPWLAEQLEEASLHAENGEVQLNLDNGAGPVPELTARRNGKPKGKAADPEFDDWLADHAQVTGRTPPGPKTKAYAKLRSAFHACKGEGLSVEDLKFASRGAHASEYRRENGYDKAESVLRITKVHDLVIDGRKVAKTTDHVDEAARDRKRLEKAGLA